SLYGAARLIMELDTLNSEFDAVDDLFEPPVSTFEPTRIEANVPNVNTIPGKDIFYVDCRILPVYPVNRVIESVERMCKKVESELNLSIEVETVNRGDAVNPSPVDSPVVKTLQGAIKKVKDIDAKTMGIGGGTVAAFFREQGLPAAVWGSCFDCAHMPN